MKYERLKVGEMFWEICTERKAREWLWKARFAGKDFVCPKCQEQAYWQHRSNLEIRECVACKHQYRLRVGTIFQDSKLPLLKWVRALQLVMQGKRGISALELMRQLALGSYHTAFAMLHKIRRSLQQRDSRYRLQGICELDGACFGKKSTQWETEVLMAVETKAFVDEKGRPKEKAGFAKVCRKPETKIFAQEFVNESLEKDTLVNTDGSPAFKYLEGVDVDYQDIKRQAEVVERWLPWVHKLISNAKTWLLGTHHGRVSPKYLANYLAEYIYRFNRRHDPDSLFHRALTACALANPIPIHVLCA